MSNRPVRLIARILFGQITLVGLLHPNHADADLIVDTLNTTMTVDFQSFLGHGFAPNPTAGQLDSDTWRVGGLGDGTSEFGDTAISGDFARGSNDDGGVATGGIYSFLTTDDGNRMLGVQPTENDFTPGFVELRILNDTGQGVPTWVISYDIFHRNDQDRANSISFSYSANGADFTDVPLLAFTSPETKGASPSFESVSNSTTITTSVPDGGNLFLRWTGDDVSGSGSRDEFGLDNVSVTATPEPSVLVFGSIATLGLMGYRLRKRRIAATK